MILHKDSIGSDACEFFLIVLVVLCCEVNCTIPQSEQGSLPTGVNCSEYCQCQQQDILHVIHDRYQKHNAFAGLKYGEDLKAYSKYVRFLGMYSFLVGSTIEIKCMINDGRAHTVSSLLNGIEQLRYTSLSVNCRAGERLIWDVPSWTVTFNIFESRKCNVVPEDASESIVIPMNMWVFDVENIGDGLLSQFDIRYTINTLVYSVSGTDTFTIPDGWRGDAMISVDRINLQSNKLKRFECKIEFIKNLDTLNLDNNELAKFPECLLYENYQNIRFLSLSSNEISEISCLFTSVPFLSTIEIIDLSDNSIENIGKFNYMENLSILDLSFNDITQINDDAFINLQELKKLFLHNNRIQYIGPVAFRDISLQLIKLNSNLMKFVRIEQFPAKEKIEIDLRKNKLKVPPFIQEITKRDLPINFRVFGGNNPYRCDCAMIEFEEYIDLMDSGKRNTPKAQDFYTDLSEMKCTAPRATKGRSILDLVYVDACIVVENCPQNCDCTLLNKSTFVVNCSARRFLEMPETIPIYPNVTGVLDMSHNPLQLLSHRWYLPGIHELYLDNCLITSVTPSAIAALQNIRVLRLHNNLLHKLPSNMKTVTLKSATNVTLHNNRWSCSCDSLWLPTWISTHRNALWMPGKILCNYLNKPVEDFSLDDINCEGYSFKDVVLAVALILTSLLSTYCIFVFYNKDIKLLLYSKLGARFGAEFCYGDQFNPYDVFVSYGQENYKWVVDNLVPRLEQGPQKYRLCLHSRDFPPDEPTVDNIPWAIRLSRCCILVLSKQFMRKEWSILELRSIFTRMLMSTNKLIIIATSDVNARDLTPDLAAYMNTHQYLQIGEPQFWKKLEMFLPPKTNWGDISADLLSASADEPHEGLADTKTATTMDTELMGTNNTPPSQK